MSKWKKLFSNYFFNGTLLVVFAVFVLWLVLKDNPKEVLFMIGNADVKWLALIGIWVILERIVTGYNLTTQVRASHPEYKYRQGILNSFVGGFFNAITPSSSGGQFAQVVLFHEQGIPYASAASVMWMDFIVYQVTMVSFVLIIILLRLPYFMAKYSAFFVIVFFGFLVNAAVIVALWGLANLPKLHTWVSTKGIELLYRLKLIQNKEETTQKMNEKIEQFQSYIQVLQNEKKMIWKLVIGNLIRLILLYSIPYLCAKALHIARADAVFFDMFALAAFVAMVNAFIPLPGSSGGTEATFLLMYGTLFASIDAKSIMILWRSFSFYFILIIEGIVYLYAKIKMKKRKEKGSNA